jgi:diguanylate cyclase (GGDEF)-like protein
MEFSVHRHDPTNPASVASEQIFAAFEDETGLLWFGTGAGGVSRLNPATEAFAHYRRRGIDPAGLPSNTVWAFHEDADGIVWIATDGGLARMNFESGRTTVFAIHPGAADPKSNAVYSVLRDGAGRLWVGAETGLYRFDEPSASFEKMDVFPAPDADAYAGTVNYVVQDDTGLLWLGTYNGLVRFDPNSRAAAIFNVESGSVTSNWVMAIVPSRDGLWVGTEGGLNRVDPATGELLRAWRNEPDNAASLSHNAVQTLLLTRSGELWIGTTAGLNRHSPAAGNFTRYTTADGLPSNYIYAIVEDTQDAIWIGSNRGLARLYPQSGEVESFSVSDGLQSNEFNSGAVHRGHSGRLYFGGINGFNRFDPTHIGADPQPPRVGITGVNIMAGSFDSDVAASVPTALELAHDESVFRIEFAVFDYKSPASNRFLYKLDGFDTQWRDGGTSNDATYTNLDPGNYLFRVRGANGQGTWSENEAALPIEITPPFTRSWTAYTIYAALGLCLAGLLMRLWTERMGRENLLRVEQQKRGLAEHLQRFTQGIASTFDAGAVAEQLLGSAADIVTYDCGAVYVQEGSTARLLAAHKVDEPERLLLEHMPETNPDFFSGMRALKARTISGTQLEASGFARGMPPSTVLRYVPLISHGKEFGVMVLMRRYGPRFGVQDMSLCAILAQQAVVAFENARLFAEVQRLAVTDELTGLYNRRRFFELARQEFNRSVRHDSRLAMVILDADHFKRINDEHGHLTGDRVLTELARLCRAATRSFDVLGRYGGEELIIMLPETALATARNVAARIRADVESNVTSSSHGTIQLTVSIGVAVRTLGMRDLSSLVEAADNALFQAKREGRNRVVTAA